MKFMHLADLHLGKRVNEFSMLEDQKHVLDQVLRLMDEEKTEGLIIAGDIYDRQVPSLEAVRLLDYFLTEVAGRHVPVYMIGGNHDSIERISFGARLMSGSGIHMASEYNGTVERITVEDAYGVIDIYMLPFLKPAQVRAVWKEEAVNIHTYQEAMSFVLSKIRSCGAPPDSGADGYPCESLSNAATLQRGAGENRRSILIAHQFVAGASGCDSEEHTTGGLEQVDVACFDGFDYVALGHLHGPQRVCRDTVRYAGTLLKYSFSEVKHKKSVTIVDMREKGTVDIHTRSVSPLHDMRLIRGSYEEVTCRANYANTDTRDYVGITLTDEEDVYDAISKLRVIYPNLMKLEYDNTRTRQNQTVEVTGKAEEKSPIMMAEELFMLQNNKFMSEEQRGYVEKLIREAQEEET